MKARYLSALQAHFICLTFVSFLAIRIPSCDHLWSHGAQTSQKEPVPAQRLLTKALPRQLGATGSAPGEGTGFSKVEL